MPDKPHEDPAALLAELRARIESATDEISQLTAELARRDGCIDELESVLDTVLGLVEVPIMVVDHDHRIRALSRGAAKRFGRDASVGKPLSSVVPEEVFATVRRGPSPPDESEDRRRPSNAARTGTVASVAPLPGDGAIVVLANGTADVPSDARREHGRRDRRSR